MMNVNRVNTNQPPLASSKSSASTAMDTVSKSLQSKISDAQKQRQELSANQEMTAEEKISQRQKIQQEISDLKRQLRQHEMEQKQEQQKDDLAAKEKEEQKKTLAKEQQQASPTDDRDKNADTAKTEDKSRSTLQQTAKRVVSTQAIEEQSRIENSAATKREGRVRLLESEIRQDKARGSDTKQKKAQLDSIRKKEKIMDAARQSVMMGGRQTSTESAKAAKQSADNSKRLYNSKGMLVGSSFQTTI